MLTPSRIRFLVDRELTKQGLDPTTWRMDKVDDDASSRSKAILVCHPSMGSGCSTLMLSGNEAEAEGMIRRHATTVRRLLLRDADIHAHGKDVANPPPWAHLVSDVCVRVLRNIGIDPSAAATYAKTQAAGMRSGHESRLAELSNNDYDLRGIICATHARIVRIKGRGITIKEHDTGVTIALDVEAPLTLALGSRGRRITEMVDHPALAGIDEPIVNGYELDGKPTFLMSTGYMAVDEVPQGCSREWQRVDLDRTA